MSRKLLASALLVATCVFTFGISEAHARRWCGNNFRNRRCCSQQNYGHYQHGWGQNGWGQNGCGQQGCGYGGCQNQYGLSGYQPGSCQQVGYQQTGCQAAGCGVAGGCGVQSGCAPTALPVNYRGSAVPMANPATGI